MLTMEEDAVLEDNRAEPQKKVTYRLPQSDALDVTAIAKALGLSQDEVVKKFLRAMSARWKEEATSSQKARFDAERAKLVEELGSGDDEPEPTTKARPAAKKGGR